MDRYGLRGRKKLCIYICIVTIVITIVIMIIIMIMIIYIIICNSHNRNKQSKVSKSHFVTFVQVL